MELVIVSLMWPKNIENWESLNNNDKATMFVWIMNMILAVGAPILVFWFAQTRAKHMQKKE